MADLASAHGDGPRLSAAPRQPVPAGAVDVDPARHWARATPAAIALRDHHTGRTWRWDALDAAVDAWSAHLKARGVDAGDRVAVLARNRSEHLLLWLACLRRRAALVPLNWRLTPRELRAVLRHAQPRVLFGDAASCEGLGHDVPWTNLDVAPPPATGRAPDHALVPDDIAMVLYTSGSTGQPKGAQLPVRQLIANADSTARGWELGGADVVAVTSPLFHTGAWHAFTTPVWWAGGTVVLAPFEPATWLARLAEDACTVAFVVPTQLAMVAAQPDFGRPLPAMRRIVAGGASCAAPLRARCRDAGYPVVEGFGMTEFGPNCFTGAPMSAPPGTVGTPMPSVEARLVDSDGHDVADDTPGELWLRGPQAFTGYLHDDARTREVVTDDGWYRTGDMLQRDASGTFRVAGRRRERFISGGEHVYPGEVEAVLSAHPAVAEVVVVAMPDPIWGDVGCAFVQSASPAPVDVGALLEHARAQLAAFKVPKRVVALASLPRLGTGKPDRAALAAHAASLAVEARP